MCLYPSRDRIDFRSFIHRRDTLTISSSKYLEIYCYPCCILNWFLRFIFFRESQSKESFLSKFSSEMVDLLFNDENSYVESSQLRSDEIVALGSTPHYLQGFMDLSYHADENVAHRLKCIILATSSTRVFL
jgi:hypothetical protein